METLVPGFADAMVLAIFLASPRTERLKRPCTVDYLVSWAKLLARVALMIEADLQ